MISLLAGLASLRSGREAARERDLAQASELTAGHEALVSRSLTLRSTNRAVAALLAVESWRQRPDALARSALTGTFTASPAFMGYQRVNAVGPLNGVVVPGGRQAIVAIDGRQLTGLDLRTGDLDDRFDPPPQNALKYSVLRISGNGRYVASLAFAPRKGLECGFYDSLLRDDGRGCSALTVYDTRSGDLVFGPVVPPFNGGDVAINEDGSLVAVAGGFDGDLATYRLGRDKPLGVLAGLPRPPDVFLWRDTAAVAFGPESHVYLGSMSGPVREVDATTMRVVRRIEAPTLASHNNVIITKDHHLVVAGDGAQSAFDLRTGRRLWTVDLTEELFSEPCPFFAVAEGVNRTYCGNYFGQLEERSLTTGERTGLRLDPQLGSVGDLAVTDDGRELIAFSASTAVLSRWRLDGSGLVSRLAAPARTASLGFNGDGSLLVTASTEDIDGAGSTPRVVDAETNQTVVRAPDGVDMSWAGTRQLALMGDTTNGVLDVDTGQVRTSAALGRRTRGVWPEPDGVHAWAVNEARGGTVRIERFDARTGRPTGALITAGGFVDGLAFSPGATRLYVTFGGDVDWFTRVFEVGSGEEVAKGLESQSRLAVSADGRLVGADPLGDVTEFDPETLAPLAKLPGARAGPSSLQFSADGSLLLVTSADQSVQVYDVATRARLGDAIPSGSVNGTVEGWLRPDGAAIAVNGREGVTFWSIDPPGLIDAACILAGRNLTETEWETYLGDARDYRATCPQYDT